MFLFFSLDNLTWTKLSVAGIPPSPRQVCKVLHVLETFFLYNFAFPLLSTQIINIYTCTVSLICQCLSVLVKAIAYGLPSLGVCKHGRQL